MLRLFNVCPRNGRHGVLELGVPLLVVLLLHVFPWTEGCRLGGQQDHLDDFGQVASFCC